jgi:membrane fusion protein, heavy metal efflux system
MPFHGKYPRIFLAAINPVGTIAVDFRPESNDSPSISKEAVSSTSNSVCEVPRATSCDVRTRQIFHVLGPGRLPKSRSGPPPSGTWEACFLDALVQLELDQTILDKINQNKQAIPEVYRLTKERAVQGDRTEFNRALNNLKAWDIPQDEIDALNVEAKKISADKDAWFKSPLGQWIQRENQATGGKVDLQKEAENRWGLVTLRSPIDGVVVERNVHMDELVLDNTVNLFQIADVSRLLVIANCPEAQLPSLSGLRDNDRRWSVRTVGAAFTALTGTIDDIGYVIDPNQHTAVIKGYVENPGRRIRAGQFSYPAKIRQIPPQDVPGT